MFDFGEPSFFLLSQDAFEIINLSFSVYKGSLYFDNNEITKLIDANNTEINFTYNDSFFKLNIFSNN